MFGNPVSHRRILSTLSAALLIALVIASPVLAGPLSPAAVLIVDDFSLNQGKLTATLGSPASSSAAGAGVLGTERDIRTTVTSDAAGSGAATAEVINHALSHSQDSGIVGNTLVQWDGTDGSMNLNPTGLGGVDLTQGNTQNGLQIEVILNDLPINLAFTVYSGAGNSSTRTITLPGGQPSGAGPKYYYVEYASFTTAAGTGANFQSVGAIEMLVDGYNDATDLTIHDIRTAAFDWGDLPDSSVGVPNYPTRFSNNGPRHLVGNLWLGDVIDSTEIDGVPSVPANGDDLNPATNDEDGVAPTPNVNWQSGANGGSINVTVTGGTGCLAGWIDWNNDGDLGDSGENIFNGQQMTAGNHTLTFSVPVNPSTGSFYARFRLFAPEADGSCLANQLPTGQAINGEVEDYLWSFGPNAITLANFDARATTHPWTIALVLPLGLVVAGVVRMIRRHAK